MMSQLPPSLSALRKMRGLSQEDLGKALAVRLGRSIGASYAQKKIANFESGKTAPTPQEKSHLAAELGVDLSYMDTLFSDAPYDGLSILGGFAPSEPEGRTLIASCILSRPRAQSLTATIKAAKEIIEDQRVWMAVFVPYPRISNLPDSSEHTDLLVGQYAHVRSSISDSNLSFRNSIRQDQQHKVALYFPKTEANIFIPPVLRQFVLRVEVSPDGSISKSIDMWTPDIDSDESRPIKATGVYTLDVQIDLWSAFFGGIVSHWIEKEEYLPSDAYWARR